MNYTDLMAMLEAERARMAGSFQYRRNDLGGMQMILEGDDDWQDPKTLNFWSNGLTGNRGVTYVYDPGTDSFRVAQGDATSGIQRFNVSQGGIQDLGFEDIDRKGKYNRGLRTMAAITGAVLGAGALAEAWAAGSGLSTGAQGAFVASPEQMAANAAWSSGGAAEVAGGAGASALGGSTPAAGGLTMEGILGSNFAAPAMGAELGAGAMYGAPTTLGGATAAMTTGAATGPLLESGAAANGSWDVLPAATQPAMQGAGAAAGTAAAQQAMNRPQNPQQNAQQSMLERLMSGGLQGLTGQDIGGLLGGLLGARNQYNFGQALLDRAAEATPNRGFYEGQLRQTYENPGAYLQSPEYQAAQDIVHNKLQRSDAAGGRLANDIGRQTTLQNHALSSLGQYRQGLSGIVGQNQNAFTGANSMYTAGQAANNSWSNGILYPLLQQGK